MKKSNLHKRNKHQGQYDLNKLITINPKLGEFIIKTKQGKQTIDFSRALAVKNLNIALLKYFYKIKYWDIPEGYLCPPVPGRVDHIHYLADLLASENNNKVPKGKRIRILDIGVGCNCIYPILGNHEYGWSFIGSEFDTIAIKNAQNIVNQNEKLKSVVQLKLQNSRFKIFEGIVEPIDFFDLTICNPPFHHSPEEALAGTNRKWKNLGRKELKGKLNFGGQSNELWFKGGEIAFIKNMIHQSQPYSNQCLWFSSLVSKKTNLPAIYNSLQSIRVEEIKTIEMVQGQKYSRIVAWTFLNKKQRTIWQESRWT